MRRIGIAAAVSALVLAGAAALAAPGGKPKPPGGGKPPPEFEITGSVAPVYPFVDSTLSLKVENPEQFAIVITSLDIEVDDASPDCQASNLAVEPVEVPFEVPGSGEVYVNTTVRLVDNADDACQNAVFLLTYTGTGARN